MNTTISPEDMASFEVLHTQNHAADSFPSEEYSFLPDIASTPIPNGDINHVSDNFDLTNMHSALTSTMPSIAETQLLEIIEENNSLKEKLNKNNAMMKEQMVTISAWREHMISSKDQQQQSLEKAKEKISILEKEKVELSEHYEQVIKMNQKEKTQFCEKCTVFDNALNNMLAIDSFEDNESILLELSYFREYLLPNLIQLCGLLETLSHDNLREEDKKLIKSFILLLKFKIAVLEAGNSDATVQIDEESGYEVIHKKSHELDCLRKDNAELCEKVKFYKQKLQEYELGLKSKFELINNKLDIEASLSEKYKERCECLQQQLEECQTKLDRTQMSDDRATKDLREDVQNLQDILKLEQQANQGDKDKLAQVMLKCEKLQVDYERVSKLLELEMEKSKELITLKESDEKKYLSRIDELIAQSFEMEEQLKECNEVIRKLREQLAETLELAGTIPLFKQQIEVYEKDFGNIKLANEKANEELEKLTNELKKYEKKCDSCPCSCKSQASASRIQRNGSSSENKDQNDEVQCPFCSRTFKNEREVYHHIHRCHKDDN